MAPSARTAFITGAGRNIGRAIAIDLARRGVNVVVNGQSNRQICEAVAREVADQSAEALVVMGDAGQEGEVKRMAGEALARFGTVDIVVNNASIRPSKPFLEMDAAFWHHVMDVDLHAAFYTCQAFLPGMVARSWGRVVNITGMNAIHGYAGRAPVSVAKHGLWGLTKALAKEFGPQGITVNAVSPGPIRSEAQDPAQAAHIEAMAAKVPVGRAGRPDDIAGLCGFLCDDAGSFVNGQMIASNGGLET
jgi:3-oxoacyl-[acyl-carrier protein] reductase